MMMRFTMLSDRLDPGDVLIDCDAVYMVIEDTTRHEKYGRISVAHLHFYNGKYLTVYDPKGEVQGAVARVKGAENVERV